MPDTAKRRPGRPRKNPPAMPAAAPEPRQRPAMYEAGERPTACLKCGSPESRVLNTYTSAGMRFRRRQCVCGQHWASRVALVK